MSDQKPETPQDSGTTQHLPAHGPDSAAWTTWVPTSEQHHAPAHSWSPPAGGTAWTPPPLPEATQAQTLAHTQTEAAAGPAGPAPTPTPAHQGTARQGRPQVTYLPPPSGPNWGLVVVGLVFALVGAGVVANQVAGFQVTSLSELGPSVLVVAGLACAFVGLVGIVTRRRRG